MMSKAPQPALNARLMRYLPRERFLGDFVASLDLRLPGAGLEGDCLEVFVARRRVVMQRVHWQFPGGQAEVCSPVGGARVVPFDRERDAAALLGPEAPAVAEAGVHALARALQERADCSEAWWARAGFAAFVPRRATGTEQRVEPAQADFFELGGSHDDKVPYRTLRLGRTHDEIVDDHAWHWRGPRVREIVVRETLDVGREAGRRLVEAQFGPEVAEVAVWFAARRVESFA